MGKLSDALSRESEAGRVARWIRAQCAMCKWYRAPVGAVPPACAAPQDARMQCERAVIEVTCAELGLDGHEEARKQMIAMGTPREPTVSLAGTPLSADLFQSFYEAAGAPSFHAEPWPPLSAPGAADAFIHAFQNNPVLPNPAPRPPPEEPLAAKTKRKVREQWGGEPPIPEQVRPVQIPPPLASVAVEEDPARDVYRVRLTFRVPGEHAARHAELSYTREMMRVLDWPDVLKAISESVLKAVFEAMGPKK